MKKAILFVLVLMLIFSACGKEPVSKPESSVLIKPETSSSEQESALEESSAASILESTTQSAAESQKPQSSSTAQSQAEDPFADKNALLEEAKSAGFTDEKIESMRASVLTVYAMDYASFRAVLTDSEAGIAALAVLKNNPKSEKGFLVVTGTGADRTTQYLYLASDSPKALSTAYETALAESTGGTPRWFAHMDPAKITAFSFEKGDLKVETKDSAVLAELGKELCNYSFAKEFVSENSGNASLAADENYYSFRLDFKSGTYYFCSGNADSFTVYTSDLDKTVTYKIGYKAAERFCKRMEDVKNSLAEGKFEIDAVTG